MSLVNWFIMLSMCAGDLLAGDVVRHAESIFDQPGEAISLISTLMQHSILKCGEAGMLGRSPPLIDLPGQYY